MAFVLGQTGDITAYRYRADADAEVMGNASAELTLANLADLRDAASF